MPEFWQGLIVGWVCGTFVTLVSFGVLLIKLLKSTDK